MRMLSALVLIGLTPFMLAAGADITGTWTLTAYFDENRLEGGEFDCTFKQTGEQLSGDCSERPLTGEVKGQDALAAPGRQPAPDDDVHRNSQ